MQANQLWIGLGFVTLLVIFFMIAFFMEDMTPNQQRIFRLLSALCAGFAGALLVGEALFTMNAQATQGTTFAVRGTAGFALFFAVWYGFRQIVPAAPPPPPPDAFHFTVPAGWTFRDTVESIAKQDKAIAKFIGFLETELAAPLRGQELHTTTALDAIRSVHDLTLQSSVRAYDVSFAAPAYQLRIIS